MPTHVQLFFRRCHRCLSVTFGQQTIERCVHCGKPLARFFYFDEQYVSIDTDSEEQSPLLPGEMRPLKGVSVFWSEWSEDPNERINR